MSRLYNRINVVKIQPTLGQGKTKEFKKKLEIKNRNKSSKDMFKEIEKKAKGGRVGLKGGSFPDVSGDGKTTMKDILMGRGVIPKPKNKKKIAKKIKTPMEKAIKKNKKKII